MAKIVVGMSGGVDSSLTAALLKEQGHEVIGLFMRNWRETDDSGCCTADSDFQDVREVCDTLSIPYYSVDFSAEYYDRVFKLFLDEYAKGRTPNPDVLCNKEIKFDCFLDYALKTGADYVATGHYCNVEHKDGLSYLKRAKDDNKDQTYFLNQLSGAQLDRIIFPLGDIEKSDVRTLAKKYGLPVAEKKDSTGICFIGERNFRKFLAQYLPMKKGEIRSTSGEFLGYHDGVYYYTLGQRRGLGLGGKADTDGDRWFVLDKDVKNNILIVSNGETDILYNDTLECDAFNFIPTVPNEKEFECEARIRHRQPLEKAKCIILDNGGVRLEFERKQRAIAEGQYAVIYIGQYCLGGGVIERKFNR